MSRPWRLSEVNKQTEFIRNLFIEKFSKGQFRQIAYDEINHLIQQIREKGAHEMDGLFDFIGSVMLGAKSGRSAFQSLEDRQKAMTTAFRVVAGEGSGTIRGFRSGDFKMDPKELAQSDMTSAIGERIVWPALSREWVAQKTKYERAGRIAHQASEKFFIFSDGAPNTIVKSKIKGIAADPSRSLKATVKANANRITHDVWGGVDARFVPEGKKQIAGALDASVATKEYKIEEFMGQLLIRYLPKTPYVKTTSTWYKVDPEAKFEKQIFAAINASDQIPKVTNNEHGPFRPLFQPAVSFWVQYKIKRSIIATIASFLHSRRA